jgi:tRNA pseudouridine55 synthase
MMDGLILVDKPRGATSHDIVARVRRSLGIQRVGHFGTLDPLATGLLLVAVGRAVKLFPFFSRHDKVYTGEIRLGVATDTYDAEGEPVAREAGRLPDRAAIVEAMSHFVGDLLQTPPPYSAKKLAGKPLYKWARSRKAAPVSARPVRVDVFRLTDWRPPVLEFEVRCGSGTYVRSLAHELGERLGCGAHLASLRRLAVGGFLIADARPIDRVEDLIKQGRSHDLLHPLESLLPELPKLILTETGAGRLQKGRALASEDIHLVVAAPDSSRPGRGELAGACRLFDMTGRLLAMAQPDRDGLRLVPFLVFHLQ